MAQGPPSVITLSQRDPTDTRPTMQRRSRHRKFRGQVRQPPFVRPDELVTVRQLLVRCNRTRQSTTTDEAARPSQFHIDAIRVAFDCHSLTYPDWLSLAGAPNRLWVVDIRDRRPWCPYPQQQDELVTHEFWWVIDQLGFCGGVHPKPTEDAHVKLLDLRARTVRIIGEGSWRPGAAPREVAKRNWWHASGSEDGRWIAADNWHGGIMLFDGKTARPRLLRSGHRTYGQGEHPEVGWDRRGEQVVFASHQRGGVTVCVATIPPAWQADVFRLRLGLDAK